MKNFFDLKERQQRILLEQTAVRIGIPVQAVEKDLWVSTLLHIVFSLPFADKLVFKGGTSLSKSFGLIERFSEDIDLIVDRTLWGVDDDLTKKQIKKLRKSSSLFVRDAFATELSAAVENFGLASRCQILAEADGVGDNTYPEPRKIDIYYASLFAGYDYLQPKVMLEIGARSLFEPTVLTDIQSLVTREFPQIRTSVIFPEITTATPSKTFLEKVFLLHELFTTHRAENADRKSRHLYDLERMMDCDFALAAVADSELWDAISHHREVFMNMSGMDYTPDIRDRLLLLPPTAVRDIWAKDYRNMQDSMIYGHSLPFDALLERIELLQNRFRADRRNTTT